MRILHTSDWHLGKYLENHSRLDEQEEMMEEIIEICDKESIDAIIIAGDIYDNSNPPVRAEKLFYDTIKRLSNKGDRIVIIIAGNHDSPDKLTSIKSLASEYGIVLLGTPKSKVEIGPIGCHKILDSCDGSFEIERNKERVVIAHLPFPSQQRINEVFGDISEEKDMQITYSDKVKDILTRASSLFRFDTINIATSHLFVVGGETSDSERVLQVGGGLAVGTNALDIGAQYIALGHLHKPQKVKSDTVNAYYSGSPLQYSKSEIGYSKSVYVLDIIPGEIRDFKEVYLSIKKPIEEWVCNSIDLAIEKCRENVDRNVWVYLSIKTDRVLTQDEIKQIKTLRPDILSIVPIFDTREETISKIEDRENKSIVEVFKEFYMSEKAIEPREELMELLGEIVGEDE